VCSILEKTLEEMGDLEDAHRFAAIEWENGGEFQWSLLLAELHTFGYTLGWIHMDNPDVPRLPPAGWSIANGPAARGLPHSCVAYDGAVVHDPHPDRAGLLKIDSYDVLIQVVREDRQEPISPGVVTGTQNIH
jgi:hypothetical protein